MSDPAILPPETLAELERLMADGFPIGPQLGIALLAHATALARQLQEARADLEICMEVLDKLAYPTTITNAILSNLGPAAVNEIWARAELADRERKRTEAWKRAEQDADRLEAEDGTAPAAGEGVGRD